MEQRQAGQDGSETKTFSFANFIKHTSLSPPRIDASVVNITWKGLKKGWGGGGKTVKDEKCRK